MNIDKDITTKQRKAFKNFMQEHKLKAFPWAKKAGVSESTIRNYINGLNQSLTSLVLEKLARSVKCRVSDLIGENNPSLNRKRLIQSFIKSEELIKKSNLNISAEERINILLAWYDLKGIVEQEAIENQLTDLKIERINKHSR